MRLIFTWKAEWKVLSINKTIGIGQQELQCSCMKNLCVAVKAVWCGVPAFGIIGPYFFENNNQTVTVNSDGYANGYAAKFYGDGAPRTWDK